MTVYTVQIEASDTERDADRSIWQALHPSETVEYDGPAEDVARDTARNQNIADGGNWRVRVWDGADADTGTEPAAVAYPEDAAPPEAGQVARSWESASTPIADGGWKYDPGADAAEFAEFTAAELHELARDRGFDFSAHPAMLSQRSD